MDRKKIFIVVVTYNAMPWIDKCLGSIIDSTITAEIIVVDNVSTDETISHIKENYPVVKLFPQKENLGFGGANNVGINFALENGADFIYLLNEDAWLESNTLEILVDAMISHPEYGVISPLQITANKDKLDKNFGRVLLKNEKCAAPLLSDFALGKKDELYQIPFFQAAHWFVRRECIEKVGLFSPVFKHYGEDNEYLHRVYFHGFKTGISPNTRAVHDRAYRSNDNLGTKLFFIFNSYLGRASNINRRGVQHINDLMIYSIAALGYKLFISFFFFLTREHRAYMKNVPSPFRVEKYNKIHKRGMSLYGKKTREN